MGELILYSKACQAIAAAKNVDEVKEIRDQAAALRAYAQQAKNRQLEADAMEIRFRAERRVGELIRAQKETVGLATGGQPYQRSTGSEKDPVGLPPALSKAGIDKKLADRARKLAAVPEDRFEGMVADWRERVERENERVTTNLIREGERAERDAVLVNPAPPSGRYSLLYADPPWRYEHVRTESRAIENQYPTLSLEEICALPIRDIAADDATLIMWATSPKLAESMAVIEAWGFSYRTCAVWDKERIGMGYYFRQQHELLLVAIRGAPPVPKPANRPPSVFRVARDEKHSQKPLAVMRAIERMYPQWNDEAARVELFCRDPQPGWSKWGNEAIAA